MPCVWCYGIPGKCILYIRYAMGIIGLVQRILGDSMQLTELEAGIKGASKTQQRTTPYCHNYTRFSTICTVYTHD